MKITEFASICKNVSTSLTKEIKIREFWKNRYKILLDLPVGPYILSFVSKDPLLSWNQHTFYIQAKLCRGQVNFFELINAFRHWIFGTF